MWRDCKPPTLLLGKDNGVAIVEHRLVVPQKAKHRIAI